jgi:hypothetical protein
MVGSAMTGSTTSVVGGSSALSAILSETVLAVEAGEVNAETDPATRRSDTIFILLRRNVLCRFDFVIYENAGMILDKNKPIYKMGLTHVATTPE